MWHCTRQRAKIIVFPDVAAYDTLKGEQSVCAHHLYLPELQRLCKYASLQGEGVCSVLLVGAEKQDKQRVPMEHRLPIVSAIARGKPCGRRPQDSDSINSTLAQLNSQKFLIPKTLFMYLIIYDVQRVYNKFNSEISEIIHEYSGPSLKQPRLLLNLDIRIVIHIYDHIYYNKVKKLYSNTLFNLTHFIPKYPFLSI